MKKALLLGVGIIAGVALTMAGLQFFARPYVFSGSVIDPGVPAADFSLTDQRQQPFKLSAQTGKVVLLFFGYTACPDACPATLGQFKQIRAALGAEADAVKYVLVTVDPERDTPERLAGYLQGFDPAFIGLTGSTTALEAVWRDYGVYVAKQPIESATVVPPTPPPDTHVHTHTVALGETDYLVDHTVRIYAIDPEGKLRLTYSIDTSARDMAEDIKHLLHP